MKTKIIPFNSVMAMDIQKGKIKGKIVRRGAQKQVCEILDFAAEYQDKCSERFLIVKVPAHDFEEERLWIYHQDGKAMHSTSYEEMWYDLVLEVPDEPQFKPFDKVLVRSKDNTNNKWFPAIYAYYDDVVSHITIDHKMYANGDCIPYEGNESLVGTTNNPKEE
jgi:hypothetical protein